MSVKLHEVMSAAQQRSASLAAEVAGYLVLAAADQVAGSPRATSWDDVALMEDGSVRVVSGAPSDEEHAQRALRVLLGQLLLEASSVTPSLLRTGNKPGSGGVDSLIQELEAALVPVNRAAARRALSRLHRDVMRAKDSGTLAEYAPSPPPAPLPEPTPCPSPELEKSVELSGVLVSARAEPAPAPTALSEAVIVTSVVWPEEPVAADKPREELEEVEELETVIPITVELSEESVQTAPVMLRSAAALPEVPDLDLPPSPSLPAIEVSFEEPEQPATVPQPVVSRAKQAASHPVYEAFARTPPLGSIITELEPPEWPIAVEVSEPAPSVLELAGQDATDRVPSTGELLDELGEELLASVDPPPAEPARRQPEPTPLMPELAYAKAEPSPEIEPEPAPLPEVSALAPAPEALVLCESELEDEYEEEPLAEPMPEPAPEAVFVSDLVPAPEALVLCESELEEEYEPPPEPELELEPDPAFHFIVDEDAIEYRTAAELLDDLDIFWQSPESPNGDEMWEQVLEAELVLSRAFDEVETGYLDDGALLAEGLPGEPSAEPELALMFEEVAAESDAAPEPVDIYCLPARPLPAASAVQAPPRYAPRKSDISELLHGFSVATESTERELCVDLKSLAGMDATALPPAVEIDETPAPIAVVDSGSVGSEPSDAGFGRALAVGAALVIVAIGGLAARTSHTAPALAAAPVAAPAPIRTGEPVHEPVCSAELTVRKLPAAAQPRLRGGPDGTLFTPSRIVGDEAVFEALPCRESVELTVKMPGRGRWLRVPVSGEELSPSAEAPSLVRHAVTLP